MPQGEIRCFAIMPFSKTTEKHTKQYWTLHFTSFLKPLIEDCPNVKAHRSEPLRGDILRMIIRDLVVSPIVVADLTDTNPNVYWELGVRQSFKHGTVTIAEADTEIPFDVGMKGILFYHPDDHLKNAEFERDFKKAIKDILANPESPDSQVLEAISGRGTLYEIIRRIESIRRLEGIISECRFNSLVVDQIVQVVEERERSGETLPAAHVRTSAVELLMTQRYLDEDSQFYARAENYHGYMDAINHQLTVWKTNLKPVDNWFKEQKGAIYAWIKEFLQAASVSKQKLEMLG